jgi:hypothetical protein
MRPAIEHDVHGPVRRSHLNGTEDVVPMLHDIAKDRVEIDGAIARDHGLRIGCAGSFAEEENDIDRFVRLEPQRRLKNTTGIEAGAHPLGKRGGVCRKCGGIVQRAISAQKFPPVGRPGSLPSC